MIAELTVDTTPDVYQGLVELGDEHGGLRAWAIGTGGHGAGLARHLAERGPCSRPPL